jgi:hypothetical protein
VGAADVIAYFIVRRSILVAMYIPAAKKKRKEKTNIIFT